MEVKRAGAGAAVVAADQDDVAVGLGHAGGHRADADLGHQLDADARLGIAVLEVEDELGQVLDRVDVVVRRRADQAHAGRGVADLGDPGPDLVAGKLAALAGLGPLGHLDLQLVGIDQVLAGHAEPARGHLLDRAALAVAVGQGLNRSGSSPPSPVFDRRPAGSWRWPASHGPRPRSSRSSSRRWQTA